MPISQPLGRQADAKQLRDPAARTRLTALVLALVVLWPMLQTSGFTLQPFFDANNLKVIGGFLVQFLPPETSNEFLDYLGQASLQTLAIATAGMALAFVIAVPMAYLSTGAARSGWLADWADRSPPESSEFRPDRPAPPRSRKRPPKPPPWCRWMRPKREPGRRHRRLPFPTLARHSRWPRW